MIKNNKILTKEDENAMFSNTYAMNLKENQSLDTFLFLNDVCKNCGMNI